MSRVVIAVKEWQPANRFASLFAIVGGGCATVHFVQTSDSYQLRKLKQNLRTAMVHTTHDPDNWVDREPEKAELLAAMGGWQKLVPECLLLVANARCFGKSAMVREMLAERSGTKESTLFGGTEGSPLGPSLFMDVLNIKKPEDAEVALDILLSSLFFKPWFSRFFSSSATLEERLPLFKKAATELAAEGTVVALGVDNFSKLATLGLGGDATAGGVIGTFHMLCSCCLVIGVCSTAAASADLAQGLPCSYSCFWSRDSLCTFVVNGHVAARAKVCFTDAATDEKGELTKFATKLAKFGMKEEDAREFAANLGGCFKHYNEIILSSSSLDGPFRLCCPSIHLRTHRVAEARDKLATQQEEYGDYVKEMLHVHDAKSVRTVFARLQSGPASKLNLSGQGDVAEKMLRRLPQHTILSVLAKNSKGEFIFATPLAAKAAKAAEEEAAKWWWRR
jgi:hypothetical protein